jgi:poly(hydroxyalkanoate) granule-associated protein
MANSSDCGIRRKGASMAARRKQSALGSTVGKARETAGKIVRDAFESAQDSVQTRIGTAREAASETWDNLEALFQSRVHKALQQLGVPSAEEIRLLTRRVAELNESVTALAARSARAGAKPAARKATRKAQARKPVKRATAHARR